MELVWVNRGELTSVILQQLVIEIDHLLEFSELKLALAEVESEWNTHFLQGLPVLSFIVHFLGTHRAELS